MAAKHHDLLHYRWVGKHRRKQRLTGEEGFKVSNGVVSEVGHGLRRENRHMRCHHDIVHGEELAGRSGLVLEDIEAGAGDPTLLQRPDQLRLVDVRAAADVHDDPVLP